MNPERYAARQIVNYAVSVGKLSKLPCEVCGAVKVEAHHTDYTKPLVVQWLCRKHHNEAHGKQGVLVEPRSLLLKVKPETHAEWVAAAGRDHLSLSEWIRKQCNRQIATNGTGQDERDNGSTNHKDVPGPRAPAVRGRRTAAGERVNGRTVRGEAERSVLLVHGAGESTRRTDIPRSEPTSDTGPSDTVTKENFAELAAGIPQADLDRWARSLPVVVLPSHSGTSHRFTCLCANCLEYRRSNGLPYGGPVKKAKA